MLNSYNTRKQSIAAAVDNDDDGGKGLMDKKDDHKRNQGEEEEDKAKNGCNKHGGNKELHRWTNEINWTICRNDEDKDECLPIMLHTKNLGEQI